MKSRRAGHKAQVHHPRKSEASKNPGEARPTRDTAPTKPALGDSFGATEQPASLRQQLAHVLDQARRAAMGGLQTVAEPFIISATVNIVGSTVVYFGMGIPPDPGITATFQAVGTGVGMAYPTVRQKVIDFVEQHRPHHDAPATG